MLPILPVGIDSALNVASLYWGVSTTQVIYFLQPITLVMGIVINPVYHECEEQYQSQYTCSNYLLGSVCEVGVSFSLLYSIKWRPSGRSYPIHTQSCNIRPDNCGSTFLTKAFFGKLFEGEMLTISQTTTVIQIFCEPQIYCQVIFKSMKVADDTFWGNSECESVKQPNWLPIIFLSLYLHTRTPLEIPKQS